MPAWVDTAEEEKAWKKAKGIVAEQRNKRESEFTDRDWGLVSHIAQNILKSSALSATTDRGLIYRLAKVDRILKARAIKAKGDEDLPEDSKGLVEGLKKVMSFGGQAIAKLRKAESSGMEMEEAKALADELMATATKLEELLNGLK